MPPLPANIRLLIADDHEVVRKGLVLLLRLEPGFEVVGEARDGAEAIRLTRELCPDVLLLDLKMPVMSGDLAAQAVRLECPRTRILILSGAEIDDAVLDMLDTVDGYLLKDVSPGELAGAIRALAGGRQYFHSAVTRALLERTGAGLTVIDSRAALSPREMDVLRLMATAATYREIGGQLFISEETVRSHVKGILAKLHQPNRTQAVVVAVKMGLIKLD